MGAVFYSTSSYSAVSEQDRKDLAMPRTPRARTLTAPTITRTGTSNSASRTHSFSEKLSPLSPLGCNLEPLLFQFPPSPSPAPNPGPVPTPAPPSVSETMSLSSHRGSLVETDVNQVLTNVDEGSEEEEVVDTIPPCVMPTTSQSDGSLCVRTKRVLVMSGDQQMQKQEHNHHHHHHHHHRHNHSYYGRQQQQEPQCCAGFGAGDLGSGSGKHRFHSNSCSLI